MTAHVETKSDVDGLRGLVLPELRTAVARLDPWLAEMARHHFGRCVDDQAELFHSALTVLAAEAFGGSGLSAVPGAVAVELAHNATLIHNDIICHTELRRGRPALWHRFGIAPAIMAGDALRALAFELLAEHDNRRLARMLGAAMRDLVSGQAMTRTGALMSAALAIGAELGGGGPEMVAILAQVGQHLGLRQIDHAHEMLACVPMPAAVRDQFAALCDAIVERGR